MKLVRLTFLFFKGLERNFKIIKYGDVPEVYQTPVLMERYAFAERGGKAYPRSIKELGRHLLRPMLKIYELPSVSTIYCGGSANNEREFTFFSQKLADDASVVAYQRSSNLSFVPAREVKKTVQERILSVLLFLFCCIYLCRIKLGPISLKYLIVYSKVFLQVFCTARRQGIAARLAVVANDHTDFPVAASMIMQYFEVPVVYVQHAEISESFPPLDFDVAILRNKQSLMKYRKIGEVKGEVFIVPRREKHNRFERIFEAGKQIKTSAVIYLSSVYNLDALSESIALLKANPSVEMVAIKPHPRADFDTLRAIPGINIADSIPSFQHVAIVPNSSVAIELLEQGVPVFQNFELDDVGRDYYGFVADGIACEIATHDLGQEFWKTDFYNEQWLVRFAQYSPSVDEAWREAVPRLASKIQTYLAPTSAS